MHRDKHTIRIDRVRSDEVETLLKLYADLFFDREPLTKCLGFSRDRMIAIARSMHTGADANPISRGLCWMARDHAARRDVGFIACDDPAEEGNPQVPDNLTIQEKENISAMMALLEEVRKPVIGRIGSEAGKCLHIAAIGIAPGYEGAGIATDLLQTALDGAIARGFVHAFSECTGIASRKCHEKSGFQNLHCVAVNSFSVNGACPFSSSDIDVCLLWKDLAGKAC